MSALVSFRPVCPSGDGGVLELCSSLSPLDPLPYSTWPSIYSASSEGEQKGVGGVAVITTPALPFDVRVLSLSRVPRGFAVTLLYGKINSEKQLEQCEQSYLPPTQIGILKVMTV